MKVILITGRAGCIGVNLVRVLTARGDRILILDGLSASRAQDLGCFRLLRHKTSKPRAKMAIVIFLA